LELRGGDGRRVFEDELEDRSIGHRASEHSRRSGVDELVVRERGVGVVLASSQQLALGLGDSDNSPTAEFSARSRRIGWARLLARVFAVEVTVCRKCGGRMRVLDVVTDPDDIVREAPPASPVVTPAVARDVVDPFGESHDHPPRTVRRPRITPHPPGHRGPRRLARYPDRRARPTGRCVGIRRCFAGSLARARPWPPTSD